MWSVLREQDCSMWNLLGPVPDVDPDPDPEDKWCVCWPARVLDSRERGGALLFESLESDQSRVFHYADSVGLFHTVSGGNRRAPPTRWQAPMTVFAAWRSTIIRTIPGTGTRSSAARSTSSSRWHWKEATPRWTTSWENVRVTLALLT